MDVQSMEEEAFAGALKQVASMIQRPDQLEKLPHLQKTVGRKKAAVDAMLKTAVHVQLENIRTGLNQLQTVASDAQMIQQCCVSMEEELSKVQELKVKLKSLREESRKHLQCSTAKENLKAIYEIQQTVDSAYELIANGRLLDAHCSLVELENARDNVMFEVFKTKAKSVYDQNILSAYFSQLQKLMDELEKQIFYIVARTLEAVRGADPGPQRLVTALRIIEREEGLDKLCAQRYEETGFMPIKRPRGWRKKAFEVLEKLVIQRVEGNQLEDRMVHKEWLARYLELIRLTVVDDLCIVKRGCVPCFPPEYRIFDRFVKMYHKCISNRLREIAADELEKNELIQLLGWISGYTGKDMLGNAILNLDAPRLAQDHPLLPKSTVSQLIDRFTNMTSSDVREWLGRTLSQEKDDWYKGAAPEKDCDGAYYTPVPSILFQMIDDQVQLAKEISNDAVPNIYLVCLNEVLDFTNRFKEAFQALYAKHFEDRSRIAAFTQTMVSIANVCFICADSAERLKANVRLSLQWETSMTQSVAQSVSGPSMRDDLLQRLEQLRDHWTLNGQIALKCLVNEVEADISVHLLVLLTNKWTGSSSALETICCTLDDYFQDHRHLKRQLLKDLLSALEMRIVQEYLKAFNSRRITFQNFNERKVAMEQIKAEAKQLRNLFSKLSSETMLEEDLTVVLDSIADMLSSQDRSLLALEVSSFVKRYPNVSLDQLSGAIQSREDVGRSEARQLAQEILNQHRLHPKTTGPMYDLFKF